MDSDRKSTRIVVGEGVVDVSTEHVSELVTELCEGLTTLSPAHQKKLSDAGIVFFGNDALHRAFRNSYRFAHLLAVQEVRRRLEGSYVYYVTKSYSRRHQRNEFCQTLEKSSNAGAAFRARCQDAALVDTNPDITAETFMTPITCLLTSSFVVALLIGAAYWTYGCSLVVLFFVIRLHFNNVLWNESNTTHRMWADRTLEDAEKAMKKLTD